MQAFLASDVVYAQRVAPLIKDALDKNNVNGQQIAASRFMTDVSWLAPATVASHLGRSASTGSSGTSGQAAPGLHGHGLDSTSIGAVTLQPEAPGVVNRPPWSSNPTFTVKFTNQGDNNESNVKISVSVKPTSGKTIAVTKTIGQTTAKQSSTVNIPLGSAPPANSAHHRDRRDRQGERREDHEQQPLELHRHLHALSPGRPGARPAERRRLRIHRSRAYPSPPWTTSPRQRGSWRSPRPAWRSSR